MQKGIAVDPNSISSAAGQESAMLIASLRDVIRGQAAEIEKLQTQLKALSTASSEVRCFCSPLITHRTAEYVTCHVGEQPEANRLT